MLRTVIGVNRYLRQKWSAVPVRAQIELIHYTFEGNGGFKGSFQMLFGKISRLATLIVAPKGAMVTRFPEAKLWWGMRIFIINNG